MELDDGGGGDVEGQSPQVYTSDTQNPLQKGQHAEKAGQLATLLSAHEACPTSRNHSQVPLAHELAAP